MKNGHIFHDALGRKNWFPEHSHLMSVQVYERVLEILMD